jgi:alpha-galactosidase
VDRGGIQPTVIGDLPEQCAALNRTNINVQLMAIEAARTQSKDAVYQAVMLDPHAGAELSIDDIVAMCDELFEAHRDWMPEYH